VEISIAAVTATQVKLAAQAVTSARRVAITLRLRIGVSM